MGPSALSYRVRRFNRIGKLENVCARASACAIERANGENLHTGPYKNSIFLPPVCARARFSEQNERPYVRQIQNHVPQWYTLSQTYNFIWLKIQNSKVVGCPCV